MTTHDALFSLPYC